MGQPEHNLRTLQELDGNGKFRFESSVGDKGAVIGCLTEAATWLFAIPVCEPDEDWTFSTVQLTKLLNLER